MLLLTNLDQVQVAKPEIKRLIAPQANQVTQLSRRQSCLGAQENNYLQIRHF